MRSPPLLTIGLWSCVLLVSLTSTLGDTLYKDKTPIATGHGRVVKGTVYWTDCSGKMETTYRKPPYWVDEADNCDEKIAANLRWHGVIVRISKDQSSMDVRKGNIERKIYFDSSTQWTKGKEALPDMSQFKEGSDVICIGKAEKGEFHATRVQLQP